MPDYDEDSPLPVSKLRQLVPELRHISPQTIYRWQRFGVKSASTGERIRLASQRIGARVMSSLRQARDFLRALNEPLLTAPSTIRTPAARESAATDAIRRLAAMGVVAE